MILGEIAVEIVENLKQVREKIKRAFEKGSFKDYSTREVYIE